VVSGTREKNQVKTINQARIFCRCTFLFIFVYLILSQPGDPGTQGTRARSRDTSGRKAARTVGAHNLYFLSILSSCGYACWGEGGGEEEADKDHSRPVRSWERVGAGGGGGGPGREEADVMVQKEILKLESARAELERERAALVKEREAWRQSDECARLMQEELVLVRAQVCVCVCVVCASPSLSACASLSLSACVYIEELVFVGGSCVCVCIVCMCVYMGLSV